jgi:hypothetical protein
MPNKAKAAIGLSIGIELVRRGLARPTQENRFASTDPIMKAGASSASKVGRLG